jgi:hypothetical protein
MFNNAALDVVIGLVFIYLLYSLLGTLLEEMVASFMGLRGKMLLKAIQRMLDDDIAKGPEAAKLSKAFYDHPLIKYFSSDSTSKRKKPAYITSDTFSKVLVDLLRGQDVDPGTSVSPLIQKSLTDKTIAWKKTTVTKEGETPRTGEPAKGTTIEAETLSYLKSVWADSQGDVEKFKEYLEQWFNEMMDRTSGWYKKHTQRILFCVGLIIAIFFNVDTIKIAIKLQDNPKLREQLITQATEFTKNHPTLDKELQQRKKELDSLNAAELALSKGKDSSKLSGDKDSLKSSGDKDSVKLSAAKDSLHSADKYYQKSKELRDSLYNQATTLVSGDINKANQLLAIGWEGGPCKNFDWYSIFGWVLTALAISLGAPFWFDLLNKLMKLRSSVSPDDDKKGKTTTTVKKTEKVGP